MALYRISDPHNGLMVGDLCISHLSKTGGLWEVLQLTKRTQKKDQTDNSLAVIKKLYNEDLTEAKRGTKVELDVSWLTKIDAKEIERRIAVLESLKEKLKLVEHYASL